MTTEQSRIIPIETAAFPNGINSGIPLSETADLNYNINNSGLCSSGAQNNNSDAEDNCSDDPNRKPSYVGLSCAVSGYSNFIRYTSPSRKNSPPQTFRVESGPQVLDNSSMKSLPPVRGQQQSSIDATDLSYYPASHTRKIVQTTEGMAEVQTVTKFYNNNNNNGSMIRETSPGSDTSSVGSGGSLSSGGNGTPHTGSGSTTLVQKQIERLYGGKMSQMRLTSPEPKSDDSLSAGYSPESGSAADSGSESLFKNSPLELKTLKVPAVFRLLRPEFREQLKNNSCLREIPTDFSLTPTSTRTRSDRKSADFLINQQNKQQSERIIPIEVDQKLTKNTSSGSNGSSPEKVVPDVTNHWSPTNGNDLAKNSSNKVAKSAEGRIIPVVCDSKPFQGRQYDVTSPEKPALPAKPTSPTRTPRSPTSETLTTSTPLTGSTPTTPPSSSSPTKSKDITSPALVSSLQKASNSNKKEAQNGERLQNNQEKELNNAVIQKAESPVEIDEFPQPEDLEQGEYDEELMEAEEGYPPGGYTDGGGVRERTLLCPIQEEDTESTASAGSSVTGIANNTNKRSTVINNNNSVNQPTTPDTQDTHEDILEEVHDGHYFIKILENEIFHIEEQICDFEEDLSNEAIDFPGEIHEELLAAIGKAKLLMAQKLAQFRGLCEKNINIKVEDDPFVPTQGDLAGFWDMVHIQVVHIHTLFAELRKFQKNDWKRTGEVSFLFPEPKKEPEKPKKYKRVKKANSKTGNESKSGSEPKSEAAKARDEARKKMLEDRKKQMKLKQQQKQCENSNQENEVIFVEF